MEPVFKLSKEELQKVIALIKGIEPDIDHRPAKAKHKVEKLVKYFTMHYEALDLLTPPKK